MFTLEMHGQILDIGYGNEVSCGGRDTTGKYGSVACGGSTEVVLALYERDLCDHDIVRYLGSVQMQPSQARAFASAVLSTATEAAKRPDTRHS